MNANALLADSSGRVGGPAVQRGPTATDPRTGRKAQWNGQQWVPVR